MESVQSSSTWCIRSEKVYGSSAHAATVGKSERESCNKSTAKKRQRVDSGYINALSTNRQQSEPPLPTTVARVLPLLE